MPKIGYHTIYYWDHKEKAARNTERHQVFREELYPLAKLSAKEFQEQLKIFKEQNFDLLASEKSDGNEQVRDLKQKTASQGYELGVSIDSRLNNKLEG